MSLQSDPWTIMIHDPSANYYYFSMFAYIFWFSIQQPTSDGDSKFRASTKERRRTLQKENVCVVQPSNHLFVFIYLCALSVILKALIFCILPLNLADT